MPPRKKAAAAGQESKEAGGVPIAGASGIGVPGGSGEAAGVQAIPPARKKRTEKNPTPTPAPNPPGDPAPPNPPAGGRDTGVACALGLGFPNPTQPNPRKWVVNGCILY